MEKIRSFLAIDTTKQLQNKFHEVQSILKETQANIKFVDPEKIHLTLKFLGDTDPDKIPLITDAMEASVQNHNPFQISIKNLGVFPSLSYMRVIWVGVEEGAQEIIQIQKKLDEKISKLGFKPEKRKYVPHITIGRVKGGRKKKTLQQYIQKYSDIDIGTMLVRHLRLKKSELKPTGPIYSTVSEVKL